MSEHNINLKALVTELNKKRDRYTTDGIQAIKELYHTRGRKKRTPDEFKDSSFLYIRAFDGDIGNRPTPNGIPHWRSPDISFTPTTSTTPITTNELQAGETYLVRCRLHNRGDLTVPYPKVEFFLTDPSLGFDTRYSTYLGVSQMNGLLLSNGIGEAQFVYRVPPEESGHKCFFARTYSFSPLDKPNDVYVLSSKTDRHIGQKNLNIIAQASAYSFNLIHMPNAQELIQFIPVPVQEIAGFGLTSLGRFNFKSARSANAFYKQEIKIVNNDQEVETSRDREGIRFSVEGEGPGIREQARVFKAYHSAIKQINAGKARPSDFKEIFREHHQMNAFIQKTKLSMKIPNLELAGDEAMAFNIINTNAITGQVTGGITLIVVGKG